MNRKVPYSPALPVVNILCDIQAASYTVIAGIAKPSVIAETDVQAMLGRRQREQRTKYKNQPRYHTQCGCDDEAYLFEMAYLGFYL